MLDLHPKDNNADLVAFIGRLHRAIEGDTDAANQAAQALLAINAVLEDSNGICVCLLAEILGGSVAKSIGPDIGFKFLLEFQQSLGTEGHCATLSLATLMAGALLGAAVANAGGPQAFALKVRGGANVN